jgi:hypothetical protein
VPFTFVAHQGAVLPLKQAAPRWFDGTALVVGSAVPDLVQAANEAPWSVNAHTLSAQVWLCWPVTVVSAVILKWWVAPVLAPHLPDWPPLHLRDYGALGRWPRDRSARAWTLLVVSALAGLLSHLLLDSFTHSSGWVVQNVEALRGTLVGPEDALAPRAFHVYDALQQLVTLLGAAIAVASLGVIGRRRIVRQTYGPPPWRATDASRRRVVRATAAGAIVGVAATVALRDRAGSSAFLLRPFLVTFAGLLIGCLAARRHLAPADA